MTTDRVEFQSEVEARIEVHLEAIKEALESSGVSESARQSILQDVRGQIVRMLAARAGEQATLADLEDVLSRMLPPHAYQAQPEGCPKPPAAVPTDAGRDPKSPNTAPTKPSTLLVAGGVILPVITLTVELLTHISAQFGSDPIPTTAHVALIAWVPIANLFLFTAIRNGNLSSRRWLGFANALAIGICLVYALLYAPMTPFAFLEIVFCGLGLLPLTPLIALVSTVVLRRRAKACFPAGQKAPIGRLTPGILVALLALAIPLLPAMLTNFGANMALSTEPGIQAKGMWVLRNWASEQQLLRLCYSARTRHPLLSAAEGSVTPKSAAKLYYCLTGKAYSEVMRPPDVGIDRGQPRAMMQFDPDVRDELGSWQQAGLGLASSRLDGHVDSDAGFGYLEWTMSFSNPASSNQLEAVSEVALPPGGVVSRLTLWVGGKEREAAFAGRSEARAAYEQVVERRMDPVVVTTSGPDRVQVRCFPVPANGTMKVRLGITFPLLADSREQLTAFLPYFTSHNFSLPANVTHNVRIESAQAVEQLPPSLKSEPAEGAGTRLVGALSSKELNASCRFSCRRSPAAALSFWPDLLEPGKFKVSQQLVETNAPALRKLVLVLDNSRCMQEHLAGIAESLKVIPPNLAEISLFTASDDPLPLGCSNPFYAEIQSLYKLSNTVKELEAYGGQDSVPALERALETIDFTSQTAVLWVHGPQPVKLAPVDALLQRLERAPSSPQIYQLQVGSGPNAIEKSLQRVCELKSVPRTANVGEDLARFFSSWNPQATQLVWKRERVPIGQGDQPTTPTRFSGHVARLWAFDRVNELYQSCKPAALAQAVDLAVKYQLVTPPTGAVVLENQQQYNQAGLKPVEVSSVPSIPEPEIWALIAAAAAVLAAVFALKQKAQRRAC